MMLRALVTIGAVQVITMLVLLVRTKTLAVGFGPELVGVMAVIDRLLAVIAQTASFSLPFAAARFLPEQWSAGPPAYRDLYLRMRNVLLAMVLVATAGALLVSLALPSAWGSALLPYRDAVAVAVLGLPVLAMMPFLQNAIAGRMQQYRSMMAGLVHAVVLALAVAGLWWGGLPGYYAAYAVLGVAVAFAFSRAALRGTSADPGSVAPARERFSLKLPATVWRFCGALLVLAFLVPYSALFVHYQVLSVHGAKTAGWMAAAVGISLAVRAVLGASHAVFLTPNVNRGGSPEERMAWADQFQLTFTLLAGLVVPPLLLFPDLAVRILFSADFIPGAAFLVLFVFAEVLGLLSGTYQSLVVAFDRLRFHVGSNLAAQFLVVASAYLLVGPLGIAGAGLALLASPLFLLVATMAFLYRSYRLRMPGSVAARAAWLMAGLAATGIAGALLPEWAWEALLLKAALYFLVVAGFAWLLTEHERGRARAILEDLKSKWT